MTARFRIGSTAFLLVLFSFAVTFAQRGDVTIRFNGGGSQNTVFVGQDNTMEIMIRNQGALLGMSMGFSFASAAGPFSWVTPYGTKPSGTPYVSEHGDAVGKFDLGGLMVTITDLPGLILLGGAALSQPLPAHASSTKLYSLKLRIPSGQVTTPQGFCIDNIFFPPAGSWKFDEGGTGGAYPPTFFGQPNTSSQVPDAPPVCFDILYVEYMHGDSNGDHFIDISDCIFLIEYIFQGGPAPDPLMAGDANCDAHVNISDVVFLLNYIFHGGPAPC
jgi:hypothetical protein